MIDWIEITGSVLGGISLGLFYFGGLWWTVARLQNVDRPVMFYMASLFVRSSITLMTLLCIFQFGVLSMLSALAGLFAVRVVLVRRSGPMVPSDIKPNLPSRTG